MTPISSCLFVNERESTDLPLLCPGPAQPAFHWLLLWLRCPRRGGVSAPGHLCPVRHSQLSQQAGSNQVQIPSHPLAGWPCRGRPGQQSFFRPARCGPRRSAALAASLRLRLHSCAPPRWPGPPLRALNTARAAAARLPSQLQLPRPGPQQGFRLPSHIGARAPNRRGPGCGSHSKAASELEPWHSLRPGQQPVTASGFTRHGPDRSPATRAESLQPHPSPRRPASRQRVAACTGRTRQRLALSSASHLLAPRIARSLLLIYLGSEQVNGSDRRETRRVQRALHRNAPPTVKGSYHR